MRRTSVNFSCETALALADHYFGFDHDARRHVRLVDAHVFASGQLSAWNQFEQMLLPADEMRRIGRYLVHRPTFLANENAFADAVRDAIKDGAITNFSAATQPGEVIACHSGSALTVADEALADLDANRDRHESLAVASHGLYDYQARLNVDGSTVTRVRLNINLDVGATPPPVLITTPPAETVVIDLEQITELAADLDARRGRGHLHKVIRDIAGRLQDSAGPLKGHLVVRAGPTEVLNAPTGSGKSVLLRLAAVDATRRGTPVAVVVTDVATTLEMTQMIRDDLTLLGSTATVVGLVSPGRHHQHVAKALASPLAFDPHGSFTRGELGYGCALSGASPELLGVPIPAGDEPCRSLRDDDGRVHACPLLGVCDKHRLSRAAVTADVIVTNHANFQSGRFQIPVVIREIAGYGGSDRAVDRPTVAEVVLLRTGLLLIDEIDAFQVRAAEAGGRKLTLADRSGRSNQLQALEDQRRGQVAAGAVDRRLEGTFHTCLNRVMFLSERYLAAATAGRLGPAHPGGRRGRGRGRPLEPRLHLPRRWDNLLANRLVGDNESTAPSANAEAALAACFPEVDPGRISDLTAVVDASPDLAEVAAALTLATSQDRGVDEIEDAQQRMLTALTSRVPDQDVRIETADLLLHRAFREQLRKQLQRLVNLLPLMRDAGMTGVDQIEAVLGGTRTWQAAPWGPLGRIVFAFGLHADPDDPTAGQLTVEIVGGDPHGYVADLGLTTAVALTGASRPVLGVSATAFFPGAAGEHLHRPVTWYVPDDAGGAVTVRAAAVLGRNGAALRLSGSPQAERPTRMRDLGAGLWVQYLRNDLARTIDSRPARALCVVNSYDQVADLASGITETMPPGERTRLAVAAPVVGLNSMKARVPEGVVVLAADDLQRFASTDADVLIAPYGRVSRGLNIVTDTLSAITSIWACIRPIPIIDTPDQLLAHVGAYARRDARSTANPAEELFRRRKRASSHQERLISAPRTFTTLPADVRADVMAGVIVELIQLTGRARRGGTPAVLHLVDNAFHLPGAVPSIDLAALLDRLKTRWIGAEQWDLLSSLHTASFTGLYQYADDMGKIREDR